ncbi:MAG: AMP-binding protein [Alphaproteobacteria bacterium]
MSDLKDSMRGLSIRDVIDRNAREKPTGVFLVDPRRDTALSWASLKQDALKVEQFILQQGVKRGESVAYAMTNGEDAARIILGIMYGGFLATSVNLVSGKSTISYVLEHSEAKLVFVQDETENLVLEANDQIQRTVIDPIFFNAQLNPSSETQISETSDGLLMYTSGTTGRPKGVVLTHKALLSGGLNTAIAHELSSNDRALCVLPLYHINGFCVTVMGPLVSGGSVVMPKKFSVKSFWSWVKDQKCSWFSVVPTQISYLLHDETGQTGSRDSYSNLRFGRSASAPLSPDVQQAFETRFNVPIIETMGLTETAAQILSNPLPPGVRKVGSPGVAMGNEVIIGDETQTQCAPNVEGEVLVRGENLMRVYLKNEQATRDSLTASGWLRTGDLGRMDEDGYIYITGRLKELIIKGGENIAPREIDDALYSHPKIIEAAAFAQPCKQYGQRVEAAVVVEANSGLTEADLFALCCDQLGKFKTPDCIHFLDELPKGPSGKIQRNKIADVLIGMKE